MVDADPERDPPGGPQTSGAEGSQGPPELVVICGPTASGKTQAAVWLCQAVGGEVVSADAVQIYRHLDVGSAKPTVEERAAVPHHLLDVADPTEVYSAARYLRAADEAIADIRGRGLIPVVAGGCGLYIRALLYGLCQAPSADPAIRAALLAEEETRGAGHLHARLAEVDPVAASRVHAADLVRIVRALEVHTLTGRPLSEHQAAHGFARSRYRATIWGLDPGREALAARIDARVESMLAEGLVEEVAGLLKGGLPPDCPGLLSPGYREVVAYLAGALDLGEARRLIARAHRRYARRQRTWFRKTRGISWFPTSSALPVEVFAVALGRATPRVPRGSIDSPPRLC